MDRRGCVTFFESLNLSVPECLVWAWQSDHVGLISSTGPGPSHVPGKHALSVVILGQQPLTIPSEEPWLSVAKFRTPPVRPALR